MPKKQTKTMDEVREAHTIEPLEHEELDLMPVNAEADDADPSDESSDAAAASDPAEDVASTAGTDDTRASSDQASPDVETKPDAASVRSLDRNGNCGHCGNPHVARYGEGKWSCVCGAGNK